MRRLLAIVATALLSGTIGYAIAHFKAERDSRMMSLAAAIGSLSTSRATLVVIEQKQADKVVRLHRSLLRAAARQASRESSHAARLVSRFPDFRRTIDIAEQYARENDMPDAARDLQLLQEALR